MKKILLQVFGKFKKGYELKLIEPKTYEELCEEICACATDYSAQDKVYAYVYDDSEFKFDDIDCEEIFAYDYLFKTDNLLFNDLYSISEIAYDDINDIWIDCNTNLKFNSITDLGDFLTMEDYSRDIKALFNFYQI